MALLRSWPLVVMAPIPHARMVVPTPPVHTHAEAHTFSCKSEWRTRGLALILRGTYPGGCCAHVRQLMLRFATTTYRLTDVRIK